MSTNSARKELPDGWKWAKLADICMINPRRPRKLNWQPDALTTFVPMSSIDEQTGTITQPEEKIYAEVSRGYTYFEEGDVLFAKITPCMQNGKHTVASGLLNGFGFGSTEFHVIRPSDNVIPAWIHSFLRQSSVLLDAKRHFRGAVGQQRVPKEFLSQLLVPLPPLDEQMRLAAVLDEHMAMVEKARRAAVEMIDAVDALKNAVLRELLPSLGQELAAGWKWVTLKEICTRHKNTDPRLKPNCRFTYVDISSIDRPTKTILNPSTITGKDAPSRARRKVKKGDVLVSTTRPNLNAIAMVDDELDGQICSTGLCVLRPKRHLATSQWLYYCAMSREFVNSLSNFVSGAMYPAVTDKHVFEQVISLRHWKNNNESPAK